MLLLPKTDISGIVLLLGGPEPWYFDGFSDLSDFNGFMCFYRF